MTFINIYKMKPEVFKLKRTCHNTVTLDCMCYIVNLEFPSYIFLNLYIVVYIFKLNILWDHTFDEAQIPTRNILPLILHNSCFLPTHWPLTSLKPFPHWQMNDPWVLTQVEKDGQLCVPRVHSLMSIQNKRVCYRSILS